MAAVDLPSPSVMVLPECSVDKLKCYSCKGLLSVPPISFDWGRFICGRCKPTGNGLIIYEELAKYMTFPCTFEECKKQIPWGQVTKHESDCAYKAIKCPVVSCTATLLEVGSIPKHFEKFHAEAIYTNEITILRRLRDIPLHKFTADKKTFLLNGNVPYLVMAYLDCNLSPNGGFKGYQLSFGVYSLKGNILARNTTYNVELVVKQLQHEFIYSWEYQEIKLFNERCHCFDCLAGSCAIPYHRNDKINFLTSQLDNIPKVYKTNISYTINITNKKYPQEQCLTRLPRDEMELEKVLCSLCKEIMYAPIYACGCGETQCCLNCKRRINRCLNCGETLGQYRNFILEKFAENIEIPCRNIARGCKYTGFVKSTIQHGIECRYNFV